jgi:ribosomal protein L16 Arg81 hydroxylase
MRNLCEGADEPGGIVDIVMEPGDLLVIPSGYSHHCETMGGRSLHMTFFIYPMTAPRILDLLFREMVENPADREPIRFASADPAAQEALRERIIRRVREISFDDLLARHFTHDHSPGRNNE